MSATEAPPNWPDEPLAAILVQTARQAAPGRTAAIVTIRVAQILGADDVLALHDPALRTAVCEWNTHPDISDAERAVLAVTEQFVIDVHGLDDDTFTALQQHYSTTDTMAIMVHLAVSDGFTKRQIMFPTLTFDTQGGQ